MLDEFRRQLDGLIAQARDAYSAEDRALCEIATLLDRRASASADLIRAGQMLASLRQPVAPLPNGHDPQSDVDREWQRLRQGVS